jgi:GNAT superfamily N-acetyltransferase
MSVAREHRGVGIGQLIASALVDQARSWGCDRVIVETASHWTEVVAFYARCGFRITHEVDGEFCRDTFFEMIL